MTIVQAILLGITYWLAIGNLPFVGLWSLQRPLVCGLPAGSILNHNAIEKAPRERGLGIASAVCGELIWVSSG